jgi:hypothetical protein
MPVYILQDELNYIIAAASAVVVVLVVVVVIKIIINKCKLTEQFLTINRTS